MSKTHVRVGPSHQASGPDSWDTGSRARALCGAVRPTRELVDAGLWWEADCSRCRGIAQKAEQQQWAAENSDNGRAQ